MRTNLHRISFNDQLPSRNQFAMGLAWSLAFLGLFQTGLGQGTVNFNNRVAGIVVTHIYNADLCFEGNGTNDFPVGLVDWTPFTKVSGDTFRAQLLAAPGANQPESALVKAIGVTTFRTGAAAGNIAGLTATLQNVPMDAPVATIRMVVWDDSSGAYSTWTEARQAYEAGLIRAGLSSLLNVNSIGGSNNSPPALVGLQSFSIASPSGPGGSNDGPHIFIQPQSQTVHAGSNPIFSVGTSWCDGYGYQWQFNGSNLPGATTSSLSINNAQFFHAGDYKVKVRYQPLWTQEWKTNTSDAAVLTVLPSLIPCELRTGPGYGGLDTTGFHFTLLGPTGMVYRVQTSTNLSNWEEVVWVTNYSGISQVVAPASPNFPARFYRTIQ